MERALSLRWRREGMQVTAMAFASHGNLIVCSDRGDRLLIMTYHGLYPAKLCPLPWSQAPRALRLPAREAPSREAQLVAGSTG